jgi:hypothetical protein
VPERKRADEPIAGSSVLCRNHRQMRRNGSHHSAGFLACEFFYYSVPNL